jgi:hypothetical protein
MPVIQRYIGDTSAIRVSEKGADMRKTRYQNGCISLIKNGSGNLVWVFRWKQTLPDGKRVVSDHLKTYFSESLPTASEWPFVASF